MVSGGEDGLVNIWDTRVKTVTNKIEPHKNDKIARPELGNWIGAVGFNDDWLVCKSSFSYISIVLIFNCRCAEVVPDSLCGICVL